MSMLLGIFGTLVLLGWSMSTGGAIDAFGSVTSVVLVLGGTASLVLARHGWDVFRFHLAALGGLLSSGQEQQKALAPFLVESALLVRKEGTLALESQMTGVTDPFLKFGIQCLIDGCDEARLVQMLQQQVDAYERRFNSAVVAWRSWGEIAPAMGLIGTLVGLVQMLRDMKNPEQIGPAMALALVATFYGVFLSNVIAAPVAAKLQARFDQKLRYFESVSAGLQLLLRGGTPRAIEECVNASAPWEAVAQTRASIDG
jgi:chemotaxis protein MotA